MRRSVSFASFDGVTDRTDLDAIEERAAPSRALAASWRSLADRDLLTLLLVLAAVFAFRPLVDADLPGHLAYGMEHLRSGQLQHTDPYSYTVPGAPWINHEWAFELLIALVYTGAGTWGLVLLQTVAWTLTGALVLRLALRQSVDPRATVVLLVFYLLLSYPSVSTRPQLVTFLAFALLLTILEKSRERPWVLFWTAPLMAAWVNFHGGFLAGLGVLGAYTAGLVIDALRGTATMRRAGLAVLASVVAGLATLANPYGPELHRWLAWSLLEPNPQVSEWVPLGATGAGFAFLALLILVVAALWRRGVGTVPFAYLLPLAATAVLSVQHTRHVPFFAMLACATVPIGALLPPRSASDITPAQHRRLRWTMVGLAVVVIALRAVDGVALEISPARYKGEWPTGAILHVDSLLAANPSQEPLNAVVFFDWAQLAIWRWYPRIRVHYDGRHRTAYPMEVEREHWTFLGVGDDDWRPALEDADLVLVQANGVTAERMRSEPGWGLAYEDRLGVVFLRGYVGPAAPPRPLRPIPFGTVLGDR